MATARSIAVETVRRVTDERAYSSRLLPALLERSRLDARDRALATELALGTLRHLPGLDRAIGLRSSRPVARMSPGARAALRLGAYQLLFMRIPSHAAVSASVDLATPRERGFVNAILRRLADDPPVPPSGDTDDDVSTRTGLASWAVHELRLLLGDEEAEVAAEAFGERSLLCLRANNCRTSVDALALGLRASGHACHAARLHPDCLLLDGGDPARLRGFSQGWFAVQDQASAFVVAALDPQPGDRVFDACAAPGGKTAHLACLVGETGSVIAGDVRPERVAFVRETVDRLGVGGRVRVLAQDARHPGIEDLFDRVLVDAPCSGIGSARRRPELLWRPRRAELSPLARLQVEIASAASDRLRPGGRLVYSVCTFPRAETDAACDALMRHRPELEPLSIVGPDGSSPRIRLWPHRHGSDGMFVAAFQKQP
ncbi:MAG: 16S rRNA (cytosine(967)-C(5))-methyltransferase RsmB [Actinomycetota bacterium]